MDFLLQSNMTGRLVETDVHQSQSISRSTLVGFRKTFKEPIGWVINDLHAAIKRDKVGLDSALGDSLAHICVFTLISGMEWPSGVDIKKCKGTFIRSEEAGIELDFNSLRKEIKDKNFDDRVCVYEDFMRSDRLSFILTNRNGPPDTCVFPKKSETIKLRSVFR